MLMRPECKVLSSCGPGARRRPGHIIVLRDTNGGFMTLLDASDVPRPRNVAPAICIILDLG